MLRESSAAAVAPRERGPLPRQGRRPKRRALWLPASWAVAAAVAAAGGAQALSWLLCQLRGEQQLEEGHDSRARRSRLWSPLRRFAKPPYPEELLPKLGAVLKASTESRALTGLRRIPLGGQEGRALKEHLEPEVWYAKEAMPSVIADSIFSGRLLEQLERHLMPVGNVSAGGRYHAVFLFGDEPGDSGAEASRSGCVHSGLRYKFGGDWWEASQEMPEEIRQFKDAVKLLTGAFFNGAVVNVYNSSRAKIGWHSDNEYHLGPVVATLSLGRPQFMDFRPRGQHPTAVSAQVELEHNSLLVMGEGTQAGFQHRVLQANAKQQAEGPCRISITFHHHRMDYVNTDYFESLQPTVGCERELLGDK
eukprot:TRINITY_DN19149_c0_g1_i1.p1 TRINITY_DN19149_c0_g1~~TRINITY_DN19149_c0_g1_i1.p1  ORF type:complete len:363 (-),score=57.79 TRINITY_DN19149_c0_g1_i1:112-1200(-)